MRACISRNRDMPLSTQSHCGARNSPNSIRHGGAMLAEGFRGACHTRDLVTFNALGRCAKPYLSALRASLRRLSAATVGAHDLSRSLADLHQESTLIVVIEMSQSSWLVAGISPGIERHALKKIEPNENALLQVLSLAGRSEQNRAHDQTHCCSGCGAAIAMGIWALGLGRSK